MTSSMATGERRLENHGLDPIIEIIPKGTLSWGSRPSSSGSNAWGTSGLSPRTDGNSSSPTHFGGRPSSGGGTRPLTAGSEKCYDSNVNAWGSNSRPSSPSYLIRSEPVCGMTCADFRGHEHQCGIVVNGQAPPC